MTTPIVGLQYGTVTWTAVLAVADGVDVDSVPDIMPVSNGEVIFTPSAKTFLIPSATPPVTIIGQPVVCTIQNGKLVDAEGRDTVTLLADSPAMNPVGWTWRVDYSLNDDRIKGGFSFHLAPDESVDLTTITPVGSSGGVLVTQGEKGDPGEDGIGLPASEVDGLMAEKIQTAGTATYVALRDSFPLIGAMNTGLAGKQDVISLDGDVAAKISADNSAVLTALFAKFERAISRTGGTTGQVATLSADGTIVWSTISVNPATPTAQGLVRLTGDLGGTADTPTVPGLALKANDADLKSVAKTGAYADLTGRPAFSTVATSGSYDDLLNRPSIPVAYSDEQVRDVVGSTLVAGANVTITVNDATDTIAISASGGSGGTTVADGSITEAKLAFAVATQAELDSVTGQVNANGAQIVNLTTPTQRVVSANYTVVAADAVGYVLHSVSTSAVTITLPADATAIPLETSIPWRAYSTGQITFAAGSGATIYSRGSAFKSAGQYAEGSLTKVAANTWLISGDVVP